jgi:excisionase family DNA binding protein
MNSAQEDDYLTGAEIAPRFKVNPQTVRNWITRDELRAVRVGARRAARPHPAR